MEGHKVFITSSYICNLLLNLRALVNVEMRDDWLIGLQLDYNYQVKIVNSKHPEHQRIIKLINWSLEHGVMDKRDRLLQSGILLMYHLAEKFAPQEIIDAMNRLINKRRIEITINELESLFLLLIIGLSLSILIFIIEIKAIIYTFEIQIPFCILKVIFNIEFIFRLIRVTQRQSFWLKRCYQLIINRMSFHYPQVRRENFKETIHGVEVNIYVCLPIY